jgi:pilus assembly protein Flp/PilA
MSEARPLPVSDGFSRADSGATSIEYALIAALVSVFIITGILLTGKGLSVTYNTLINAVNAVFGN